MRFRKVLKVWRSVGKRPVSGRFGFWKFSGLPDRKWCPVEPYLTKSWACASCCCKWWCSGGGGEGFLSSAVNRDGNTSESLVVEVVEAVIGAVWLPVPLTETDVAVQCCPPPSLDLIGCCSCNWHKKIQWSSDITHCLGMSYYFNFWGGSGSNEFHIRWRFGTHGS